MAWRTAASGTGMAVVVAALGVLLALQGWRSRIPGFDVLTTIDAAQQLIDHHRLPDKGAISSFDSFTPPGVTWLMVPGLLAVRDPRLFEYVGSTAVYLATLLGVYLVARRCFGRSTATIAVVVYAFSDYGLTSGSSLFQRYPLQLFIVWFVYSVLRWVNDNDGRWLALATLTWVAGMNIHMELAPAIFAVPAIWLLWRPSIRVVPLALVGAAAVLLWYPYAQFERGRDYVDVRSQVFRESIRPIDFAATWCDPTVVPASWMVDAARERAWDASRSTWSLRRWLSDRTNAVRQLWWANFAQSRVPGARFLLFLVTVVGLLAPLAVAATRQRPPLPAQVFGACLAVTWLLLLLLSTVERRFYQLWPLQAIAMSAAAVYVPEQFRWPRAARWVAAASLCMVVLANAVLFDRLDSWWRQGWAGDDAPEVAVVDALAARIRTKASNEASIGYSVDFWRFMADANRVDPRYKVGADIDLLLKYRHGITNHDRCAEGFRRADDYRVVQVAHAPGVNHHGLNRLTPIDEPHDSFDVLSRMERYDVLERR